MAWQPRSETEHRYYVRRCYRDGRRCHEYLGRGPAAVLAAETDARQWAELQTGWASARTEKGQLTDGSEPLDALDEHLQLLIKAALFAAGFRQVDCPWRPDPHATRQNCPA